MKKKLEDREACYTSMIDKKKIPNIKDKKV